MSRMYTLECLFMHPSGTRMGSRRFGPSPAALSQLRRSPAARALALGVLLTLCLAPTPGCDRSEPASLGTSAGAKGQGATGQGQPIAAPGASLERERAEALMAQEQWKDAAKVFGRLTKSSPDDGGLWFNLGYCQMMDHQHDRALEAMRRAAEFPDLKATALYNIACMHALRADSEAAFTALNASVEAGFDDWGHMNEDADLESIISDERMTDVYLRIMGRRAVLIVPDDISSLQQAMDVAGKGTEILVKQGTYSEQVMLKSGVHLRAESVGGATIRVSASEGPALGASECQDAKVTGFVIEQTTAAGAKPSPTVLLVNSDVALNRCRVVGGSVGIVVADSARAAIQDTFVENCVGHGVIVIGTPSTPQLTRVTSRNHGGDGIRFTKGARGTLDSSECSGNQLDGIGVAEGAAPTIRNTTCRNNGGSGMTFEAETTGQVENNRCYDNKDAGVAILGPGKGPGLRDNALSGNQLGGVLYQAGTWSTTATLTHEEGNFNGSPWNTGDYVIPIEIEIAEEPVVRFGRGTEQCVFRREGDTCSWKYSGDSTVTCRATTFQVSPVGLRVIVEFSGISHNKSVVGEHYWDFPVDGQLAMTGPIKDGTLELSTLHEYRLKNTYIGGGCYQSWRGVASVERTTK